MKSKLKLHNIALMYIEIERKIWARYLI